MFTLSHPHLSWARALALSITVLAGGLVYTTAQAAPPKAPSDLRLTTTLAVTSGSSTNRYYQLTWQDNSLDESGFRVEVRLDNSSPFFYMGAEAANQTTWLNNFPFLVEDAMLQFRVVAYKFNGSKVESSASKILKYNVVKGTANLERPSNFKVEEVLHYVDTSGSTPVSVYHDGVLKFSWQDQSNNELFFQIFYKKDGEAESNYKTLGNLHWFTAKQSTSQRTEVFVQHGLLPGVAYNFAVRATTRNNPSYVSTDKLDSALVEPASYPVASANSYVIPRTRKATNLQGEAVDSERVSLTWEDNSYNETSYQLHYRPIGSSDTWSNLSIAANSTSYVVQVGPGGNYEWRVLAVTAGSAVAVQDSDYSNTVQIPMPFISPQGLVAQTSGAANAVNLTWQDTSKSEESYYIWGRIHNEGQTEDENPWLYAGNLLPDSTRFTVTQLYENGAWEPLLSDVEYDFKVEAAFGNTFSDPSNIAQAYARHGFTSLLYHPAKEDQAFSYQMTASNEASRHGWAVTGLPAGLELNEDTGVISGTPTVHGVFEPSMTVSYADGSSATAKLALRILQKEASPTVVSQIENLTIGTGTQFSIPLEGKFHDADTEKAVRLITSMGDIDMLLYPSLTPKAVANFMGYVESGAYDGVIFHRSVVSPTPFIVQGGAYVPIQSPRYFSSLIKRPAAQNEPGISNLRGTIAHAKVGDNPDSATHDFFFNLADNSVTGAALDHQNSGFTVFARAGESSMGVVDAIAGLPIGVYKNYGTGENTPADKRVILDGAWASFEEVPMQVNTTAAPADMDIYKTVQIYKAREVSHFKYDVESNSNPAAVRPSVVDGRLLLEGLKAGESTIVVRAKDLDGNPVSQSFNVLVRKSYRLPVITRQPANVAVLEGKKATLSVTASGTGLIYQWYKGSTELTGSTKSSHTIAAVQAGDIGEYHVKIFSDTQDLVSNTARVDFIAAPEINQNPTRQVVELGDPLELEGAAIGRPLPTYSWLRNGKTISGQKQPKLTLPAVKLTDAGTYVLRATNSATRADSTAANVIVVDKASHLMLSTPGKTLTLKAQVAGPNLIYRWKRLNPEGTAMTEVHDEGDRITGSGSPSLVIRRSTLADSGTYTCYVWDNDDVSFNAETGAWKVGLASTRPVYPAFSPDIGFVAIDYDYTLPKGGEANDSILSFAISGLPSGLKLNSTTGRITGKPSKSGEFNLKVTVKNPAGSTSVSGIKLYILPMPEAVVGAFVGQIGNSPFFNKDQGGRIDMTVTDGGKISGKLTQNGKAVSFTGSMTQLPGANATRGTATITRKGLPPLQITLSSIASGFYFGDVSGYISDGTYSVAFSAFRNNYNKSRGSWAPTAVFNVGMNVTGEDVGKAAIPQGSGYYRASLSDTGVVKVSGRLADGSTLTSSSFLGNRGRFLIYQSLYKHTGTAVATAELMDLPRGNDEPIRYRVDGLMNWTRSEQTSSKERTYKAGFGPVSLTMLGITYLKPADNERIMSLPAPPRNASIDFDKGGLEHADKNPDVSVLNIGGSGSLVPFGVNNHGDLDLKITKSTGLFSGSIKLVDPGVTPRTAKFNGLIIPRIPNIAEDFLYVDSPPIPGADALGVGHFLLAQLPSAGPPATTVKTSPILSGKVSLKPVPIIIIKQPESLTVNPGAEAKFIVEAQVFSSTTMTYQWRKDGLDISGATGTTYTIPTVAENHQAHYDVVIKTPFSTVTSDKALLDVNDKVSDIVITRTPSTNPVSTSSTEPIVFTATAKGVGPFTYKWRRNNEFISGPITTTPDDGPTYTITDLSTVPVNQSVNYSVTVYSSVTNTQDTSDNNVLIVADPINNVEIARTPDTPLVGLGAKVTFSIPVIGGSSGPYTYQWYKDGQDEEHMIEEATGATYVIGLLTAAETGTYRVLVKNAVTPAGAWSDPLNLDATVDVSNLIISRTPSRQNVPFGDPVKFSLQVAGAPPFQFQWMKNGQPVGTNSAEYIIPAVNDSHAGIYTVRVTNDTSEGISNEVALAILKPVSEVTILLEPNTTSPNIGQHFKMTAVPNATAQGPFSYEWTRNGEVISEDEEYILDAPTIDDSGEYQVRISNEANSSWVLSDIVSIDFVDLPPEEEDQ